MCLVHYQMQGRTAYAFVLDSKAFVFTYYLYSCSYSQRNKRVLLPKHIKTNAYSLIFLFLHLNSFVQYFNRTFLKSYLYLLLRIKCLWRFAISFSFQKSLVLYCLRVCMHVPIKTNFVFTCRSFNLKWDACFQMIQYRRIHRTLKELTILSIICRSQSEGSLDPSDWESGRILYLKRHR